jgi:hypothetical protein
VRVGADVVSVMAAYAAINIDNVLHEPKHDGAAFMSFIVF